jgi:hypothetical protein
MPITEEPSLSSPQKLASPTFQVPSWYTAVPAASFSTVCPAAVRSYVTVACVGEVTFTESTFAETADASGLLAKVCTALENFEPFSSRASRLLAGVDVLKNVSQLVVIAEAADPEPLADGELDEALEVAGAELGLEVGLGELELELPLEHAVTAAVRARPSSGAR